MTDELPASTTTHVLVVDDDPTLRQLLTEYLSGHDMLVTAVASGAAMRRVMVEATVDLVVLDIKLPGEDGLGLARELRAQGGVPIVLLTGRNEEADRVMGLELGADDYVTKPFSPRELLARMRAVLRRTRSATAQPTDAHRRAWRFEKWELNLRTRRLHAPDGRKLELTNGEFSLLAAFCASPQQVLSRDELLTLSRLHATEVYDRTIDVQILRLRRKVELDPANPQLIITERGVGYRFSPTVTSVY
jgi:two-component system, OmpR family, response regulator